MTCPKCGNRNAECIIANFWKCPSCDAAPRAPERPPSLLNRLAKTVDNLWPQSRIDMRASIPRVVGTIPINEVSAFNALWWRIELEHIYLTKYAHDARELVNYVDRVIDSAMDDIMDDIAQKTIQCRGGRGIETFMDFPHWVRDDGQIITQVCADSDSVELRLRGFWRPA